MAWSSFWASEINPETGLPFKSAAEFQARVARIKSERGPVIDSVVSSLEKNFPRMSRAKVREAVARYMAAFRDAPTDVEELKKWGMDFSGSIGRFQTSDAEVKREAYGYDKLTTPEQREAYWNKVQEEDKATWGTDYPVRWFNFENDAGLDVNARTLVGLGLQSEEDVAPGSITSTSGKGTDSDFAARLKEFKDALYNPQTAARIGGIAAEQSARGAGARGIYGGGAAQGIGASVADAAFQYEQGINQQAGNMLTADQAHQLGLAQLQQQARMFNAQQLAAAAQQQYNQRAGLGGTIGGIAGLTIGGIIQGATGAPVAGALSSAGTAAGTAAAGSAPYPYTIGGGGGAGSLGGDARKGSSGGNGSFGS